MKATYEREIFKLLEPSLFMLYNMCHVMLYNICHMLCNIPYVKYSNMLGYDITYVI